MIRPPMEVPMNRSYLLLLVLLTKRSLFHVLVPEVAIVLFLLRGCGVFPLPRLWLLQASAARRKSQTGATFIRRFGGCKLVHRRELFVAVKTTLIICES